MNRYKRYTISRKRNLRKGWKSISKDDRSELSRFVKILAATLAVTLAVYYVGVNGLTHIGGFWAIFTGEKGEVVGDTTAPPPPTFSPVNPYTNQPKIAISGFAEAGSEITVFVNDSEAGKTVTEAAGTFSLAGVPLRQGKNEITAVSRDTSGNESQKSGVLVVNFDNKPPDLTVATPKPGQKFSGEEKQIGVTGTTEAGATVKVNSIQAPVLSDGSFRATILAKNGSNLITITATDRAGNEKKIELTVTYEAE